MNRARKKNPTLIEVAQAQKDKYGLHLFLMWTLVVKSVLAKLPAMELELKYRVWEKGKRQISLEKGNRILIDGCRNVGRLDWEWGGKGE